jgi:hypothetical protein
MNAITIRVSPVGSDGCITTCSGSFTPADLVEELHIEIPDNCDIIFVYKGRVLSSYLTLQFQGVTSGSRLIYTIKQISPVHLPNPCPFTDYEAQEELETRRLADLGFANWEPCREFLGIAREMVREEEARDEEATDLFVFPTNITPAMTISDSPLPTLFRRNSRPCDYYYY